ncbi:MAG: SDR family NAD(P)-dependent oxidoreductase [Hyphomicrobiaceae bacterium]
MSPRLEGKIAIISGAGQQKGEGMGNGRAAAVRFAKEGARLFLVSRSAESLEETRDIVRATGAQVECGVADVSKEADCAKVAAAAVAKYGRIDILHNNVGIVDVDGDTTTIDSAKWRTALDVNLTGAMHISKHVLPVMRAQRHGCITHVSSIAALCSYPLIAYKTSKAALLAFVQWLAYENAPYGIRCNVMMLGMIDTPMGIETYHQKSGTPRDEIRKQRDALVPMGRMGTPSETASVATFLASDEASYVTGAIIPVDGGYTTRVG